MRFLRRVLDHLLLIGIVERNLEVVFHDGIKLDVDNVADGVIQTESRDKERGASGDAYDHHPHSLFEAENVSCGDLVKELHSLPDEADVFEKDALARERRLGSYEFGGHSRKSGHRGYDRHADRADQCDSECQDEQRDACREGQIGEAVHHLIDFPDDPREELCSAEEAQDCAQNGSRTRVDRVFHNDRKVSITQGPHRADNASFIVDHPAHCGRADERRDREKEYREDRRDTVDYLGIVIEAYIAGVLVTSQDICVGVVCRFDLRAAVYDIHICLVYLGREIVVAVPEFAKAVLIFLAAIVQFLLRIVQFLNAVVILFDSVVILLQAAAVLRPGVLVFLIVLVVCGLAILVCLIAGVILLQISLVQRLGLVKLLLHLVDPCGRLLLGRHCLSCVFDVSASVIDTFLHGIELLFGAGKRFLRFIKFLLAVL